MAKTLVRSPELMNREDTALLVVDVQEKLLPLIPGSPRLVWNIRRLLDGAAALGVRTLATEQYPQGLGPTTAELAQRLANIPAKLAFSCAECGELFAGLADQGVWKILVCGIETHVCVSQTVHDLLGEGFRVYVAADAVAAMRPMAESRGVGVASVALAWLLHQPVVSSVIVGATRPDQLAQNIAASDIALTSDELATLDAVAALDDEYPAWAIKSQNTRHGFRVTPRRLAR